MTSSDKRSEHARSSGGQGDPRSGQALRQEAEERVRERAVLSPVSREPMSGEEMRQTLHELRVYQIELEMQNEELRRAQAGLDAARARYFDLYDLAPVGYCTLNAKGLILEANFTSAALLGVARGELISQPLTRFILKEDQDLYYLHWKKLCAPRPALPGQADTPHACELRMVKGDGTPFWAHLSAMAVQDPAAGAALEQEPERAGPPHARSGAGASGESVCRVTLSDITERKLTEEILKDYNAELEQRVAERTAVAENRARQLQDLDRCLIRAEEAERQRIAHVLHEEVQQILVAARLTLSAGLQQVKDPVPREHFQTVDRMLLEALAETRALVHEIVPPGLSEGGLLEAVTWLSRQMRERFDFTVTVTADEEVAPLDDEVSICAYQALRELLLNVDKHAKVRRAEVIFTAQDQGGLTLTVRDEGAGFAAPAITQKVFSEVGGGLFRIRERVEGFGGRMEIVSELGRGTSVSLFLPTHTSEIRAAVIQP